MKRNDAGDFNVLYIEPDDDRNALFQTIAGQKKPVVIMLAEQVRVFQRPDDFTSLKHVKRQLNLPVVFVIPHAGQLAQLAARNGFPVYLSMDALADALSAGHYARQRGAGRSTVPLTSSEQAAAPKKTLPPGSGEQSVARTAQPAPVDTLMRTAKPAPADTPVRTAKKTIPLSLDDNEISRARTAPLEIPVPGMVSSPPPRLPQAAPKRPRHFPLLLVVLTVALVIGLLGSFLVFAHALPADAPTPPVINGRLAFTSSEQLSESSSQGIEDQVVIDMNNMSPPAAHKNYYAWLLGDKRQSDPKAILLGTLHVNRGNGHLFYPGDGQHSNLLLAASRILVTEEDAAVMPIAPSPDTSTWRYYGELSSTPINSPDNTKHFSFLDHLRHLLASDPTLDELELPGGLNTWFYRNTGKVLEWATSTREKWEETKDVGFVRGQTERVLQYLDGNSFVAQDLPPNTPLLVNERLGRIGLLEVNGPNQEPPSYLKHIVHHLDGLLQAAGATPALRKNISDLISAMNNVENWLGQVHHDAQQIVKMSDGELQQPATLTLLNDMIDNANHAYVGQLDPTTNNMREGIIWLHDHIQTLATLPIAPFAQSSNGTPVQMIPDTIHLKALYERP